MDDRTNPGMVQIHLKQSKTDQFGKGFDIILGRTNTTLCPVAALLAYIAVRGDQTGPFFIDSGARPLTKARFVAELRSVLRSVGMPQDHYAGHKLPHWGGHLGSHGRCRRFNYPDVGPVA